MNTNNRRVKSLCRHHVYTLQHPQNRLKSLSITYTLYSGDSVEQNSLTLYDSTQPLSTGILENPAELYWWKRHNHLTFSAPGTPSLIHPCPHRQLSVGERGSLHNYINMRERHASVSNAHGHSVYPHN